MELTENDPWRRELWLLHLPVLLTVALKECLTTCPKANVLLILTNVTFAIDEEFSELT
jgi:hypothetical protein